MEPVEIDWKNIVSRYERDEVYERISAPKWLDLSAPDAAGVDDVAWFCRSDCRHPVNAEDFNCSTTNPKPQAKLLRSNSKPILAGRHNNEHSDANLKRRGGIATFFPSPINPKLNSKKFSEDLENQNPNVETTPPVKKGKKAAIAKKEAIKSSAEKKCGNAEEEEDGLEAQCERSQPGQPKLKSTFSARNLFSGKDILNQISEFFHELKKLATGKESGTSEEEEKITEEEKENTPVKDKGEEKKKALVSTWKTRSLAKNCELSVRLENNEEKSSKIMRDARAFPPTPQRFPSPSGHHSQLRCSKASTNSNSSPLGKLLKPTKAPERGVLQEVEQRRGEEEKELIAKNGECSSRATVASETEGSAGDVFWFLKPCTHLIE